MIHFLERFGGYGQYKELGLIQYALAHICDALVHSDLNGARDYLALLMVGVDQANLDGNRWELAYRMMLPEEPPSQLWGYRNQSFDPRSKSFSALAPQQWTTVALAYSKEMDYIQTKRQEVTHPKAGAQGTQQKTNPPIGSPGAGQHCYLAPPSPPGTSPCDLLPSSSTSEQLAAYSGRRHLGRGTEDVRASSWSGVQCLTGMKGRACPSESCDGVPFEVQGCMPEEYKVSRTGDHAPVPTGSTLGSGPCSGKEDEGKVELDAINFGQDVPMAMMTPVPCQSWVHMFLRQVLSAKTRFSYVMLRTLSASRNGRDDSVATALFPIPMPFVDIVWSGPDLSSQKKGRVKAFKKLMHLIVMALNYEHFRNPMSILQLIRRRPATQEVACFFSPCSFLLDIKVTHKPLISFGALEVLKLEGGAHRVGSYALIGSGKLAVEVTSISD